MPRRATTPGRRTCSPHAAVSAHNWRLHYEASLDLNADEITIDEANEIWAETKANGAAAVAAFATAEAAYLQVQGGCAGLDDRAGSPTAEQRATIEACTVRGEALAGLIEAATAVNTQWDEHVQMMAAKATFDPTEYLHEWHRDVEAAPPVMAAYERAVATFEEAPDCTP